MPVKFTYLLIDLGAFIIPFIFSFHPKIKFHKQWYAFWRGNLIVTTLFLIWDVAYTNIGVWGFSERYTVGIHLFNLPIEEVLFFICIPYSSIFTYYCFTVFYPKINSVSYRYISLFLIFGLFITGVFFINRIYTSITFISLSILIADLSFGSKEKWLSGFYFMYLVILIPFFIVNGLLTGTGLNEPVVWYDNSENLGMRILTIPFEDIFYGMLLLILNTVAFERFKKKNA